jgi:hypothetical protein
MQGLEIPGRVCLVSRVQTSKFDLPIYRNFDSGYAGMRTFTRFRVFTLCNYLKVTMDWPRLCSPYQSQLPICGLCQAERNKMREGYGEQFEGYSRQEIEASLV